MSLGKLFILPTALVKYLDFYVPLKKIVIVLQFWYIKPDYICQGNVLRGFWIRSESWLIAALKYIAEWTTNKTKEYYL